MKTIAEALRDEIHYPLNKGFIENKLLSRGMFPNEEVSFSIFQDPTFKGAIADCLYALITVPNISESDLSISLSDRQLILKQANRLYEEIGEEAKTITEPKVFIGG